jgi:hypothetical protein
MLSDSLVIGLTGQPVGFDLVWPRFAIGLVWFLPLGLIGLDYTAFGLTESEGRLSNCSSPCRKQPIVALDEENS